MARPAKELIGKTFCYLTVVGEALYRPSKSGKVWECKCRCGTLVYATSFALTSGARKSCGCLKTNRRKEHSGVKSHPEYSVWASMLFKCRSQGIALWPEWKENFFAFLKDMGRRPTGKYVLGRLNPAKAYSPANCAWMTREEFGAVNRAYRERTLTTADMRDAGVSYTLYRKRVQLGWTEQRARCTPPRKYARVTTRPAVIR